MKKLLAFLLLLTVLTGIVGTLEVSASFGAGVVATAGNNALIKTGLVGKKLNFSDTDFKQGLTISDFDSITITELPKSSEGTLMLAGRRVGVGTTVRRKNIGALVFIPASKDVSESKFMFTISPYADGNSLEFILKFTDKINYEPEIDSTSPTSIMTQRDIQIYGKLSAKDKEHDKLEFIILEYPSEGTLELKDKENGEFSYTPRPSFVGEDSFSYVARDEWGNYSKPAIMTVNVSERMSEVVYWDMKGSAEYNAAVALSAMGIMDGTIIGDGKYFLPEGSVTKAEFTAMAMKVMGIRADSSITETYFDDNDDIPTALVSYVGTAQRLGYINGDFKNGKLNFNPNKNITSYEAASIMRALLGEKGEVDIPVFDEESDIPVWARDDVYVMCALGIFSEGFGEIGRNDTVTRRECAAYLYKMMNM